MLRRVGKKRGDTLIEVMFAVGIFSLVAIAVVSVMNGSLRSVQTALETTMARNEIDIQAEAIRFIQNGYAAEKDLPENERVYTGVWQKIITLADANSKNISWIEQFEPKTCDELYDNNDGKSARFQNAFIINTRKLGEKGDKNDMDVAVMAINNSGDKFGATGIYPRIMFGGEEDSLSKFTLSSELFSAEGIYVVGAPDTEKNEYYDFYIRTCWNGAGSKQVSTISTVIRLYNPDYK